MIPMGSKRTAAVAVAVVLLGSGCALGVQGTVGPVVRDVRLGEDGRILVERCNIVHGTALRDCKRQSAAPGEGLPAWED